MSFEGEIGEIDLIDKLVGMGRDHFTGAIRFENDGIIKIVYFKTGDILSASTNDRADSIDEILLRAGKVTREHVKQALAKRKESETLGDALLGLGFITRKELTWARRAQAIGILRSLRGWTVGQYTVVEDYLPKREEGTLFPLPQMLVELIVTETDRARFDRATDGGSAVFHKASDFDDAFRRLGLNQDAEDIAVHIDGSNTAADVAASSGKDAFNVYKLLEAFRVLGLLTKAQGTPQVSALDDHDNFAGVGVADAADAWQTDAKFDLDDEPALTMSPAPHAMPTEKMPSFDWDQPATVVAPAAAPPQRSVPSMPSWDQNAPAVTREIPAVHVPPPPPDLAPEPDWGFDEAQIETARRADVPLRAQADEPDPGSLADAVKKAAKPNRYVGALLAGVLIVILAAAGWFGFQWWQARNAPIKPQLTARATRPRKHIPAPTPPPLTATNSAAPTSTVAGSIVPATVTHVPMTATTAPHAGALVITPTATTTNPPSPPKTPAPVPTANPTVAVTTTTTHPVTVAAAPPGRSPALAATAASPHERKTPPPVTQGAGAKTPSPVSSTTARLERPASGNAVITNAGGPPAAGANDAQRARYDAMAREHAANATGAYTIQFELVCETPSLAKAIAAGEKVWFTPLTYRGRSCYRVYWGRYGTAAEAQGAKGEIPASLRESAPVVVRIARQP